MSVWHTFLQYYDSSVNDVGSLFVGVWFISYLVFALRKAFFQTYHGRRFYIVLTLSLVGLITSTAIPMTLVLWLWPTRPTRRWRRDHKPVRQPPTHGGYRDSWTPTRNTPSFGSTVTPRRQCQSCSYGTVICNGCRGTGRVPNPNSGPAEAPHFTCGGTGRVKCTVPGCNGGWIVG